MIATGLSEQEKQVYDRDGLVEPGWQMPDDMLVRIQSSAERLITARSDLRPDFIPLPHVPWNDSEEAKSLAAKFLEVATDPRILDLLESVIDPDIIFWTAALFCKPPGDAMEVPWHQDGQYWPIEPAATVKQCFSVMAGRMAGSSKTPSPIMLYTLRLDSRITVSTKDLGNAFKSRPRATRVRSISSSDISTLAMAPSLHKCQKRSIALTKPDTFPVSKRGSVSMVQPIDIRVFFNFRSPYCYLVSAALFNLFNDFHANLVWRPLGGWDGRSPPERAIKKIPLTRQDVARWAKKMGIPAIPPPISTDPTRAGAVSLLAEQRGVLRQCVMRITAAAWGEGLDIGQAEVLLEVGLGAGLDKAEITAAMDDPAYLETLTTYWQEADKLGVIGVPTLVIGDQVFWGNDRIDFVRDHLYDLGLRR